MFCWALGGESNNVTFLIRLYVMEHREVRVMRMPRVQAQKKNKSSDSESAGELRIHQRALRAHVHAHLDTCSLFVLVTTPLLRPGYARYCYWVPLETLGGTAAILLPGVVGASPADWYTVTVSIFFYSSSRPFGPLKLSAVPQKWGSCSYCGKSCPVLRNLGVVLDGSQEQFVRGV